MPGSGSIPILFPDGAPESGCSVVGGGRVQAAHHARDGRLRLSKCARVRDISTYKHEETEKT